MNLILLTFVCLVLCGLVIPINSAVPSNHQMNHNVKAAASPVTSGPNSEERKLYWSSNHAGMFSQLLQTKLMYDYAQRFQRTLILDTISSYHYGFNVSVDVCSFFKFKSENVRCGSIPKDVSCTEKLPTSVLESNQVNVCYNGIFLYNINGAKSNREGVVGATTLALGYSIQQDKLTALEDFHKDLVSSNPQGPFTVAHWRRGDQLVKRCEVGADASVNCEDAAAFIAKVRKYSQDKIVYVATNEPQDSKEMDVIRKAGFKTVSNVVSSSSSSGSGRGDAAGAVARQQRYNSLDALSLLAVEYSLMVRADTYLAWGISEIDDVVEYERMKMGKTHCTAFEPYVPVHGNVTFCLNLKVPQNMRNRAKQLNGRLPAVDTNAVASKLREKAAAVLPPQPSTAGKYTSSSVLRNINKNRLPPTAAATTVIEPDDASTADGGDTAAAAPSRSSSVPVRRAPPQDPVTTAAKAETKMAALIQQPKQEGFVLTKEAFSSQSRLLFVAGLEGTGHHAVKAMFTVCARQGLCEPDHTIAAACQQFDPRTQVVTGLFSGAGKDEMAEVATIEKRMRELAQMRGNHLFLVGLSFTAGAGMLSYPNFDGKHKSMDNPDVSTLAMIAESVGLDFRVLVLQRSAEEIMSSTLKRGFGGVLGIQGEPKILIESANALYSQLSLLDKKFFQCIQYKQLGSLSAREKASLVDFLHPENLKGGELETMLKEVSYNSSSSSSRRKRPENKETLDPLNSKYQTMHLANRLALIDGLCHK